MMKCKLCGFVANDHPQRKAGSMSLHAKMKHGEADYTKLFEEAPPSAGEKKPPADPGQKKPPGKKPPAAKKDHWRLLNPKTAMEKAAIDDGYTKVNAIPGVDPSDWDIA